MANAYCISMAMSGLTKDCEANRGGILDAYIAPYTEGYFESSAGTITGVTSAASFYHYAFKRDTGNFTSTLNVDAANGVNYVSTEINLVFSRMEQRKRIEVAALSINDLALVVRDANGKLWAFGVEEPVTASAGTGETGTARGDRNAYSITLLDNASSYPMPLSDSAATAFLGAVTEPVA